MGRVNSKGYYAGTITIAPNLHIALQHLRHKRRPHCVRIDASCINWKAQLERSIQVANMGLIFLKTDCVVSWLGPESNNSDRVIELLQDVRHNVEVDWDILNILPSCKSGSNRTGSTTKQRSITEGRHRSGVCRVPPSHGQPMKLAGYVPFFSPNTSNGRGYCRKSGAQGTCSFNVAS
jgi:hypothetical protein